MWNKRQWMGALLLVALVALALAGCDKTERRVEVGERFTIELEGNLTTGYSWEVAQLDEEVVLQDGEATYAAPDTGLAGSGGTFTFTFRAVGPGETTVELVYRRPWEKDVEPLERRTVQVVVK